MEEVKWSNNIQELVEKCFEGIVICPIFAPDLKHE